MWLEQTWADTMFGQINTETSGHYQKKNEPPKMIQKVVNSVILKSTKINTFNFSLFTFLMVANITWSILIQFS